MSTITADTVGPGTRVGGATWRAAIREVAVMGGLFVGYRQIRYLTRDDTSAAFDNAERVVGWERSVGAFTEGTV
ncbi:MAG: hypothetical protein KDB37_17515, partial [Ilumatobacter sp.]|nr:hypothetical protein [Ilumatobacter sp.]